LTPFSDCFADGIERFEAKKYLNVSEIYDINLGLFYKHLDVAYMGGYLVG